MANSPMMAKLMGTMCAMPATPSGMRSVSAASGPYAAELNASRPKTGIPEVGPMCSARSSEVARGLPATNWKKDMFAPAATCEPVAAFSQANPRIHKEGIKFRSYLQLHITSTHRLLRGALRDCYETQFRRG